MHGIEIKILKIENVVGENVGGELSSYCKAAQ